MAILWLGLAAGAGAQQKKTGAAARAVVHPGDSPQTVIGELGPAQATLQAGARMILVYPEGSVIFENNAAVEIPPPLFATAPPTAAAPAPVAVPPPPSAPPPAPKPSATANPAPTAPPPKPAPAAPAPKPAAPAPAPVAATFRLPVPTWAIVLIAAAFGFGGFKLWQLRADQNREAAAAEPETPVKAAPPAPPVARHPAAPITISRPAPPAARVSPAPAAVPVRPVEPLRPKIPLPPAAPRPAPATPAPSAPAPAHAPEGEAVPHTLKLTRKTPPPSPGENKPTA